MSKCLSGCDWVFMCLVQVCACGCLQLSVCVWVFATECVDVIGVSVCMWVGVSL